MTAFNKGLFFSYLILIFWLPIPLGSNRPWAWSMIELAAFLLLAGFLFQSYYSKQNILNKLSEYKHLILVVTCLPLWTLLQSLPLPQTLAYLLNPSLADVYHMIEPAQYVTLSIDPSESLVSFFKSCSYIAIMLLSLLLVTSNKRLKLLLGVMVFSGAFQAVYGSLQTLSGTELSWVVGEPNKNIATGGFIYKNHFANYLLLTLSLGVGLLVSRMSDHQSNSHAVKKVLDVLLSEKAILRIALALMVIGLVLSRSRMGNAAFFCSMTFTGIFAYFYYQGRTKKLTWLIASLLVIDTFILGAWFGLDKVQERIENTNFTQETRDEVTQYSFELIKEQPITGTGAGSYYTAFPQVQGDDVHLYYDHAHNDYIQFAVEYGVPMTLLLGYIVLYSLRHTIYTMRNRHNALMKGTAFGCMMAIIGMLIHISVDFNLQAPANAIYFILILTLSWQSRYLKRRKTSRKKIK